MKETFNVGDQVIGRRREGTVVHVGWDKVRVMWEDGAESWEDEYKLKHKRQVFMVGDHVRRGNVNGTVTAPGTDGGFVNWETGERWSSNESMTLVQRFTKGDRVKGNVTSRLGSVTAVGRQVGVKWDTGATGDYHAHNLTRINKPTTTSWKDVEVGHKVTFKYGDEDVTATAHESRTGARWPCVLGVSVAAWAEDRLANLISIEKPKPPLPTKPGSIIRFMAPHGSKVMAHRREVVETSTTRNWVSDGGYMYSDYEVEEYGWEVVE